MVEGKTRFAEVAQGAIEASLGALMTDKNQEQVVVSVFTAPPGGAPERLTYHTFNVDLDRGGGLLQAADLRAKTHCNGAGYAVGVSGPPPDAVRRLEKSIFAAIKKRL